MKDLLDKLSSYNIFNYLFPGVIFVVFANLLTSFSLFIDNLFASVFLYYFIGLTISRIGSLFLEPFLKKIKLISFSPYNKFVEVSKKDEKLELLSEVNNMYRTLSSMFLCLLFLIILEDLKTSYSVISDFLPVSICILLMILFILSYLKQTNYITKRINILNPLEDAAQSEEKEQIT